VGEKTTLSVKFFRKSRKTRESADSCLRRNDELRENDGEEDWDF
jgi:hypothetical protein